MRDHEKLQEGVNMGKVRFNTEELWKMCNKQITVECFDYEAEKESDEELELMIATEKSLEVIANA